MKLLGALILSLAAHFFLTQWQWAPELEYSGGSGNTMLSIQKISFIETKKISKKLEKRQEIVQGIVQEKNKIKPKRESSLLAKNTAPVEGDENIQTIEEVNNNPLFKENSEVSKKIKPPKDSDFEKKPVVQQIETLITEEIPLNEMGKEMPVEVVSLREEQAVNTGFNRYPTMGKPRYRKAFPPRYPNLARRRSQQGIVLVKAKVGLDGDVEAVEISASSGYEVLDKCALKTVKKWQFYPYKVDEKLIVAWVEVPVEFTLSP